MKTWRFGSAGIGVILSLMTMSANTVENVPVLNNRLNLAYPGRQAQAGMKVGSNCPAPAIITPELFRPEAERLAGLLKTWGGEPPSVILDTKAVEGYCLGLKPEWRSRPLIIIGNLEQNQAVFQLYARFLTSADARTPGAGGQLIQFIPNCYAPGNQILLVAGSTDADTRRSVSLLLEKLNALPAAEHNLSAVQLIRRADGAEHNQRLPDAQLQKDAEKLAKEVAGYGNSTDSDNHYGMDLPTRAWDALARSGRLDPALVQRVDQSMLDYLIRWEDAWWRRKESQTVFADNRHHVYGTWGYWKVAELLYHALPPGQRETPAGKYLAERKRECENWLLACALHYEMPVLSVGAFSDASCFLLAAAQTGQMEVFQSGKARRMAVLCCGVNDNLHQRVGTAGYEDIYPGTWYEEYPLGAAIPLAIFYYRDRQLQWVLENWKPNIGGWWGLSDLDHAYALTNITPALPVDLVGARSLLGTETEPNSISFREWFDPESLFFFLVGGEMDAANTSDSGKEYQVYPNMLARLSWRGRAWLVSNSNHETPWHRNMLSIDSEHGAASAGARARILCRGTTNNVSFLSAITRNCAGADWTRSFVVVNDDFLVLEDRVLALEDGTYAAVATWRSPYPCSRKDKDSVEFRANEASLIMAPVVNSPITIEAQRAPENEGALTPYVVRQYMRQKLGRGAALALQNLIYPTTSLRCASFNIRLLAPNVSLVRNETNGNLHLIGFVSYKDAHLDVGGAPFALNADGVLASPDAGAKAKFDGQALNAAQARKHLQSLWDAPIPLPAAAGAALTSATPASIVWKYADLTPAKEKLTGFLWRAPGADRPDRLFDGELDRVGACNWGGSSNLDVTVEFERPTPVSEIRLWYNHDHDSGVFRKWTNGAPTAVAPVRIWNEDGPEPKSISNRTDFAWTFNETYKGVPTTFMGARVSCETLARRLRICAVQHCAYEIELLGKAEHPAEVVDAAACSLLGPGRNELLLRTKANEVVCIDAATGARRWQAQLPVAINAWAVGDANADGLDEIGLACIDATVKRLDAGTGAILWSCDLWSVPLPLPYSLAIMRSKELNGPRGFIDSSYFHMSAVGLDGKILNPGQKIIPGMWLYDVMGGFDLNGDGYGDAISRALWGQVNLFDGKTGKVDYFGNIRGRLAAWRLIRQTDDGKPDLLVVAKNGIGRYDAHIRPEFLCEGWDGAPDEDGLLVEKRSQRTVWEQRWHSCAAAVEEWNGEFVVGHKTGVLDRYAPDGQVKGRIVTDAKLADMGVVSSGSNQYLVVNSGEMLTLYDRGWKVHQRLKMPNTGMRVVPGTNRLLLFVPDEGVACVAVKD